MFSENACRFMKKCAPKGVQYNRAAQIIAANHARNWQTAQEYFLHDQKTGAFVLAMARIERSIKEYNHQARMKKSKPRVVVVSGPDYREI